MPRKRRQKAYDDGVADGLHDHGTDTDNWTGPGRRPKGKRNAAAYDRGWSNAYDGSVRESRRAHRRLTGRN